MPKSQVTCPRCRQPVIVETQQLFDTSTDPEAKEKLLSGTVNMIACKNCGYQGPLSIPIVYHDPSHELLLTYFPPDLGMPINEQEKLIGPIIKKAVDNLPQEKRKGYLLQPKTMLTMQTMVEKILEADGITKEMLETQQQRVNLIEKLLATSPENRAQIVKQEEEKFDEDFFNMLTRLIQVTVSQGDREGSAQLVELQKELLAETTTGRELKQRIDEAEEAVKILQEAGKNGLTREILLDILIATESETKLATFVSLTRSGIDYTFFELLSKRIEQAEEEEKQKLIDLREKLLEMTQEIDQAVQVEMGNTHKLLDEILKASNVEDATTKNLDRINDMFVEVVKSELDAARKNSDQLRIEKLQKIVAVLQKASAPPPEVALIENLLSSENDEVMDAKIRANADKFTPEFLQIATALINQTESQKQPPELIEKLKQIYRAALRISMQANLKK
jgi:hypothetical protein